MHKPWQTMTIEEISEFVSGGGTPSTKVDSYWNGEVQWLTPSDVTSLNGSLYVSSTSRTITDEGLNSSSAKLYKPGTILMTSRATIGKPVINTVPMATNQGFINFLPKEDLADAEFIVYWIKLNESKIAGMGTGSTFREISKGKFKTVEVSFPNLPTQKKISHILSTIQNKIENIDKQIESFTSLKKSVMEKLFTEGLHNEKQKATEIGMIPESWNVVSISDAFVFTSKSRALQVVAPIPFIPMELIGDGSNIYVHNYNLKEKVSSGTYFDNEDLLVAKITPSFENGKQSIANIDKDYGYATTEVIPIKSTSTANNLFLFHYLKRDSIRKDLAGKMEGSTGRQRLSKSILGATKIPIPSTSEQKDIAQILTEYDIKIQILQRTKSQYHDLFSSLLNKLMINEISTDELEFKERSSSHE